MAEAYENDCRIFVLYVQKCIRIYIMCCFVSSVLKDPVDVQDNGGQLFRCKSQTLLAVVPSKAWKKAEELRASAFATEIHFVWAKVTAAHVHPHCLQRKTWKKANKNKHNRDQKRRKKSRFLQVL